MTLPDDSDLREMVQDGKKESPAEFYVWAVANVILLMMIVFASFNLFGLVVRLVCSSSISLSVEYVNLYTALESFNANLFLIPLVLMAICGVIHDLFGGPRGKSAFRNLGCFFGGMSVSGFVDCIVKSMAAFQASPLFSVLILFFFAAILLGVGYFWSCCRGGSAQKAMAATTYEIALLALILAIFFWLVGYAEGEDLIGKMKWLYAS